MGPCAGNMAQLIGAAYQATLLFALSAVVQRAHAAHLRPETLEPGQELPSNGTGVIEPTLEALVYGDEMLYSR